MCNCTTKINAQLVARGINSKIRESFGAPEGSGEVNFTLVSKVQLAVDKADPDSSAPATPVYAACCPFCGDYYHTSV